MNYPDTHPNYSTIEVKTFSGGKLHLIEPQLEHAEIGVSWTSDDTVIQYMGADFSEPSVEKERARIEEIRAHVDEYNWMIELDGKVIGNASINYITESENIKTGNFAILIGDKNFWGKGIAYHIGQVVLEWAFSAGGLDVIKARALQENTASIGMLRKLGFAFVGNTPFEGLIDGKSTEWHNYVITKPVFASQSPGK